MLEHLAYTVIYVSDIEKSTSFYRDILGIPMDYAVEGWIKFKSLGAALVLHPKLEYQGHQESGTTVHIAFCLDNLEAEYARLNSQGVRFIAPPTRTEFGRYATLVDPDGNHIDLIEGARPQSMRRVSEQSVVNEILAQSPASIEVLEDHGIRICGGCIVLLNASVRETAEFSGLSASETAEMVKELNQRANK